MTNYEAHIKGDFDELLDLLQRELLKSAAESNRDEYQSGNVRCVVRVYEEYSSWRKNYAGLAIMLVENGADLFVSAMPLGGENMRALHRKLLDKAIKVIEDYQRSL